MPELTSSELKNLIQEARNNPPGLRHKFVRKGDKIFSGAANSAQHVDLVDEVPELREVTRGKPRYEQVDDHGFIGVLKSRAGVKILPDMRSETIDGLISTPNEKREIQRAETFRIMGLLVEGILSLFDDEFDIVVADGFKTVTEHKTKPQTSE